MQLVYRNHFYHPALTVPFEYSSKEDFVADTRRRFDEARKGMGVSDPNIEIIKGSFVFDGGKTFEENFEYFVYSLEGWFLGYQNRMK